MIIERKVCVCVYPARCGGSGTLTCSWAPCECFCSCGCEYECSGCADCNFGDPCDDDEAEAEIERKATPAFYGRPGR